MVKMIATKAQTYDRRTIAEGEEFEVPDAYVGTLVSLGRARLTDQKSTGTRPMTTKDDEEPDPSTGSGADDGKYRTRRMKARGDR